MNPTLKRLLLKAQNYCAQAERCEQEVQEKLKKWGAAPDETEGCMEMLKEDDFVNNERYAQCFTSDKFRLQQWGKTKIYHHLKTKGIHPAYIKTAFATQIPDDQYRQTLYELATKKWQLLAHLDNPYAQKQKLMLFLQQRGFEPALIVQVAEEVAQL